MWKRSEMSYAVVFRCPSAVVKTRARVFCVEEGLYVYVGSCGSSCHKRILRHLRRPVRKFWHVDYLPCAALFALVTRLKEVDLAARLAARLEYVASFGSSDDRNTPSHLFKIPSLSYLLDVISTASHDQFNQARLG